MQPADHRRLKLREKLLEWGRSNTRSYPWREQHRPYPILVAEFMLHRTQVTQVEPVYRRFMDHYPTLAAFAQSTPADVVTLLYPLGLRWRIDAMINALNYLWERFGAVPSDYKLLLEVPGIGNYIAGATVCFSQNIPVALIDTNTVRVTGRVFGLDLRGEARRRNSVVEAIMSACDPDQPRDYYYAMIDLAHTLCSVKSPCCTGCPLLSIPCHHGQLVVSSA